MGGGNLDLSRVGVINPKNASGDDANAFPISVLARNPPSAMMLQAKAAFGDDDDSLSHTGLCSDFYVFEWVLTAEGPDAGRQLVLHTFIHDLLGQKSKKEFWTGLRADRKK